MTTISLNTDDNAINHKMIEKDDLYTLFNKQKTAYLQHPYPNYKERISNLLILKKILKQNKDNIITAIDKDFSGRSHSETLMAEILPVFAHIAYTCKHLKNWMRPSRRKAPFYMQPINVQVCYQPLGVVGIISPWNYPLQLALIPLVTALAAGNRVMLKVSEHTPNTSQLLANLIHSIFPETTVSIIQGHSDVAIAFTQLPFNHILFTGSTEVGRHVMTHAARNLTSVTLELGGKSPAIIDHDFSIKQAAERICFGKSLNAGQTCVATDYVLLHKTKKTEFIQAYKTAFNSMYPTWNQGKLIDYSSIINKRQYARLNQYLEDARQKNAEIIPVCNKNNQVVFPIMTPYLFFNTTDDMQIMQEEIFGPLLPVILIENIDEAIHYIQKRAQPLALYYFGNNAAQQQKIILQTHSGGICINETVMHCVIDDLPFGGNGSSGIGKYHGKEGFLTFSHEKSILKKTELFNISRLAYPPYKKWLQTFLSYILMGRQK